MAAEHEFIKNLLKGGPGGQAPDGHPYPWASIAAAMAVVTSEPSDASLEVLDLVLRHDGKIRVRPGAERPHLFTPKEALQLQAIQALAAWQPQHQVLAQQLDGLIERFADATESVTLEGIARSLLAVRRGHDRSGGESAGGL